MYLIYNIHSKTLSITPRSLHKTYSEAVSSLKQQVEEYVTKYKAQDGFTVVHSYEEIERSSNIGYFLLFSEEFNNRISVYEKRKLVLPGIIYNSHDFKILESTTFSFMEIPMLDEDCSPSIVNDMQFVNKMKTKQESMAHGGHVKYIEELKEVLAKRGVTS